PDYSNPRLSHFVVQLHRCKFIANRVHKLAHPGEILAIFNGLCPLVNRVLVNLLSLSSIDGEGAKLQYQFLQQIYADNGDPDIFHKITPDGAIDTFEELPVETAILVRRNDRHILGAGIF
ncbi:unnamed protein product, partial [marine sediment metagenome]